MVWTQESYHKSVKYDRKAEWSPENECLWSHWLTFQQPEWKSSSESSELWIVSRCYKGCRGGVVLLLVATFYRNRIQAPDLIPIWLDRVREKFSGARALRTTNGKNASESQVCLSKKVKVFCTIDDGISHFCFVVVWPLFCFSVSPLTCRKSDSIFYLEWKRSTTLWDFNDFELTETNVVTTK